MVYRRWMCGVQFCPTNVRWRWTVLANPANIELTTAIATMFKILAGAMPTLVICVSCHPTISMVIVILTLTLHTGQTVGWTAVSLLFMLIRMIIILKWLRQVCQKKVGQTTELHVPTKLDSSQKLHWTLTKHLTCLLMVQRRIHAT